MLEVQENTLWLEAQKVPHEIHLATYDTFQEAFNLPRTNVMETASR